MKKRLTALLLSVLLILSLAACSDGKDNDDDGVGTKQGSDTDEINIVPTAASSVETDSLYLKATSGYIVD